MEHISKSLNKVMESIMEKSNNLESAIDTYQERVAICIADAGFSANEAEWAAIAEIKEYYTPEVASRIIKMRYNKSI